MLAPFLERLPEFFILGAAKAGTTSIFHLLKQHPEVYLPFAKEPMFFSNDRNYAKGLHWYMQTYFSGTSRFPARGEATPHYLYWSDKTAPRLYAAYGEKPVKLIVILRDPVKRAYSWYWNMVREGRENVSFEEALALEAGRLSANQTKLRSEGHMTYGYFRGGCYASQLQQFLEYFPRQRFLFILQDEMKVDFKNVIRQLLAFLHVNDQVSLRSVRSNTSAVPQSPTVHAWLTRQTGFREWLKAFIPPRVRYALKSRLIRANLHAVEYAPMSPETEKALRLRYADEVLALGNIIGRDLSAWMMR